MNGPQLDTKTYSRYHHCSFILDKSIMGIDDMCSHITHHNEPNVYLFTLISKIKL